GFARSAVPTLGLGHSTIGTLQRVARSSQLVSADPRSAGVGGPVGRHDPTGVASGREPPSAWPRGRRSDLARPGTAADGWPAGESLAAIAAGTVDPRGHDGESSG